MRKSIWPAAAAAIVAIPTWSAHAQDARPPEGRTLEEIVVTAQKREQNLQDVPISLLVTTGESLAKQNLVRLEDLTQQMPNVHVSRGTIADQLTIRGVGSGLNGGFEQSVGTFVDGVYHGRGHFSQSSFVDVERVEVLRGPQSIYFGNNAIGGAFSVTTRKPGNSWSTQAQASYEVEARESTIEVGTGGPVSDTLGLRFAARYSDMDGWLENLGSGKRNPGIEDKFARATLQWQPGELWTTTLKAEYGKQDSIGPIAMQMTNCPPLPPFVAPAGSCNIALANGIETEFDDRRTSNPGEYGFLETKEFVLNVERQGDGIGFSGTLARTDYDYMVTGDPDGTTAAFFSFSAPETYEQTSLELRMTSPESSRLKYIAGVYGLRGSLNTQTRIQLGFLSTPVAARVPALAGYTPIGRLSILDQDEDSYSVFGAVTWPFTDKFSGTVGGRWARADKDAVQSSTAISFTSPVADKFFELPLALQPLAQPFVGGVRHSVPISRSDDDFIPSFNLQYKPADHLSFYASYSEGFKAGGFDASEASGDPARLTFDPEQVQATEIGFKSFWLGRALSLNVAAFNNDYEDLQQAVTQFNATGAYIVVMNVGELRSRGVELELDWQISDMWRFGFNFASLDATYMNYSNAGCTARQTFLTPPGTTCTQNLSGKAPPFAADYSGSTRLGFSAPVTAGLQLSSDLVVSFSDAYAVISSEDPEIEQGAWQKVDLRLALGSADGRWEVALLGKNLGDKQVANFATSSVGTAGSFSRLADRGRSATLQVRFNLE